MRLSWENTFVRPFGKASSVVNMARLMRIFVVVRVIYNSFPNKGGDKSEDEKLNDAQKEAAELERRREHGGAVQVEKC